MDREGLVCGRVLYTPDGIIITDVWTPTNYPEYPDLERYSQILNEHRRAATKTETKTTDDGAGVGVPVE